MIGIGGRRYLGKTGGDLLQAMLAPFMFWGQKTFGK
jgi:hypothetical protein